MKEILQKSLQGLSSPSEKYNALREGLQHLLLKILDDMGYFKDLSFVGGTALRIIYDLRRFSEDMDFSLQRPRDSHFDFRKMLESIIRQLEIYGLPVDTKVKEAGAVQGVFLRFKGILQEFKISRREGEKLAIKLEVDTNPPLGARHESRILQKEFLLTVIHHDLPTLFAGKLLAFLYRAYTKGRDVYDLIWYLSRKTRVNRTFFENGLFQSTGEKLSWSQKQLIETVTAKVEALDMEVARKDVFPFLDDPTEVRLFDKILIQGLIKNIAFDSDSY